MEISTNFIPEDNFDSCFVFLVTQFGCTFNFGAFFGRFLNRSRRWKRFSCDYLNYLLLLLPRQVQCRVQAEAEWSVNLDHATFKCTIFIHLSHFMPRCNIAIIIDKAIIQLRQITNNIQEAFNKKSDLVDIENASSEENSSRISKFLQLELITSKHIHESKWRRWHQQRKEFVKKRTQHGECEETRNGRNNRDELTWLDVINGDNVCFITRGAAAMMWVEVNGR